MKIGIISWNVRGLGSADKRRMVRELCNSYRVDVVMLQESKLDVIAPSVIKELSCFRDTGWCALPVVGRARVLFSMGWSYGICGQFYWEISISMVAHFHGDSQHWMTTVKLALVRW